MVQPARAERAPTPEELKEIREPEKLSPVEKKYREIQRRMKDLERPAPGMEKYVKEKARELKEKFNIPDNVSLESTRNAYGWAIMAEEALKEKGEAFDALNKIGIYTKNVEDVARTIIDWADLGKALEMSPDLKKTSEGEKYKRADERMDKITKIFEEHIVERKGAVSKKDLITEPTEFSPGLAGRLLES
jgi:hypothetical protein